jgi:hypothetical protein
MIHKWNFSLFRVILIFCCGIVIGADIIFLTMDSITNISAWCGIVTMLLVATSVLVGSRIKNQKE